MMGLHLRRYTEPHPARTALAMLAMSSTVEQIGTVENSLVWAAKNRPPADTYTDALNELRLVLEAVKEEE